MDSCTKSSSSCILNYERAEVRCSKPIASDYLITSSADENWYVQQKTWV